MIEATVEFTAIAGHTCRGYFPARVMLMAGSDGALLSAQYQASRSPGAIATT